MADVLLTAIFLASTLLLYALFGGADFGMGVIECLIRQPKQSFQSVTKAALGPIWEANHIWIILAIVITFVGFPDLFFTICIYYHLPLFIMLFGIIVRGAAFSFRYYDPYSDKTHVVHTFLFNLFSFITPLMLGVLIASFATPLPPRTDLSLFFWFTPFSFFSGLLFVGLSCLNALTFLHYESTITPFLTETKKWHHRIWLALLPLSVLTLWLGAPILGLFQTEQSTLLFLISFLIFLIMWGLNRYSCHTQKRILSYVSTLGMLVPVLLHLWLHRFPVILQTPTQTFTVTSTMTPAISLRILNITLIVGLVIIIPFLFKLFETFKKNPDERHSK